MGRDGGGGGELKWGGWAFAPPRSGIFGVVKLQDLCKCSVVKCHG